jgi:putative ATP-binding cassette transporter
MAEPVRALTPLSIWWQVLIFLWKTHPWAAAGTMVFGLIGGISRIAVLDTINKAIHSADQRWHLLLPFAAYMTVSLLTRACSELLPAHTARKIATHLRRALCMRILATRLSEIERRGAGNLLALLTHDVPTLTHALVVLPKIFVEGMIVALAFAYLAQLSSAVLALTVFAIVLGITLHMQLFRRGLAYVQSARNEINSFNENTHSLLFGIKELQLHSRRRRWFQRAVFDLSSRRLARADYMAQLWFAGGGAVQQMSLFLLIAALVFGASTWHLMDAGMITASVMAVMYLMGPFSVVVGSVPQLGEATMAFVRLQEFGLLDPENHKISEPAFPRPEPPSWHTIELDETTVTFGQPDASGFFRMGPVSARFQPGERVFIVGDNGSGKSTLAKVLAGLYMPDEGRVLLDGHAITDKNRTAYRELFSAIFVDFHLFNRIISLGKADASRVLANHYLRLLGLEHKVHIAGNTYSTTTSLSSGQRKRLALVCACLEDRPIYVFDEWAADQDPSFKRFFYEVLLADLKERRKCVVVITHDNQYFGLADRLILMKGGRVESDTVVRSALARA